MLQRAYDEHDWGLIVWRRTPFDPLRSDPALSGAAAQGRPAGAVG